MNLLSEGLYDTIVGELLDFLKDDWDRIRGTCKRWKEIIEDKTLIFTASRPIPIGILNSRLAPLNNLTTLHLSDALQRTREFTDLFAVLENIPSIRSFHLGHSTLSLQTIQHLSHYFKIAQLRAISFDSNEHEGNFNPIFASLSQSTQLTSLHLRNKPQFQLQDELAVFTSFLQDVTTLNSLELSGCLPNRGLDQVLDVISNRPMHLSMGV